MNFLASLTEVWYRERWIVDGLVALYSTQYLHYGLPVIAPCNYSAVITL